MLGLRRGMCYTTCKQCFIANRPGVYGYIYRYKGVSTTVVYLNIHIHSLYTQRFPLKGRRCCRHSRHLRQAPLLDVAMNGIGKESTAAEDATNLLAVDEAFPEDLNCPIGPYKSNLRLLEIIGSLYERATLPSQDINFSQSFALAASPFGVWTNFVLYATGLSQPCSGL